MNTEKVSPNFTVRVVYELTWTPGSATPTWRRFAVSENNDPLPLAFESIAFDAIDNLERRETALTEKPVPQIFTKGARVRFIAKEDPNSCGGYLGRIGTVMSEGSYDHSIGGKTGVSVLWDEESHAWFVRLHTIEVIN